MPTETDRPLTLVIDTNVWLDWLVFADARIDPLRAQVDAGQVIVLATETMLAEFESVIARPQFALDAPRQHELLVRLRALVQVKRDAPDCRLPCTDRNDQMFIDLAVAHRVDGLLSRDKALLRLRRIAQRRFGVQVTRPEAWQPASN